MGCLNSTTVQPHDLFDHTGLMSDPSTDDPDVAVTFWSSTNANAKVGLVICGDSEEPKEPEELSDLLSDFKQSLSSTA